MREETIGNCRLRHTCQQCGQRFQRHLSGDRPIRFCSQTCYHQWNKETGVRAGHFLKGLIPWNKDKKGIHLSPATEFKKGLRPATKVDVGTVKYRKHKRDGIRAWIKIGEPNIWKLRAVAVWESSNGRELPSGYVVHHKDRNKLNDHPSNLQAMTRAEHLLEHRPEYERKRRASLARKPLVTPSALFAEEAP